VFLGENLLPWLLLAIGGALAVGTTLALFRPPPPDADGIVPERPPLMRSIIMILLGSIAAIWALATLIAG